jgi:hypothetical protein
MAFKVQIGPPQISIHQGQIVLISDPDGQINWPSERGLYFLDTRVVSSWTVYANGEPWELLNGGPITYYSARIFLTNRSFATESGIIPPRTLGFTISRWIYGGMHEDLDITNNSMKPIKFQLGHTSSFAPSRNRDFSRSVTISARRFPKRLSMLTVVLVSRSRSSPEKLGIHAFSMLEEQSRGYGTATQLH